MLKMLPPPTPTSTFCIFMLFELELFFSAEESNKAGAGWGVRGVGWREAGGREKRRRKKICAGVRQPAC